MPGPRDIVLLVDDSPEALGFLTEALEQSGFSVLIATSGTSALGIVERITPDIILLDAVMPGLDGFETCLRLKANPAVSQTPVVFMTGLTETEHVVRALEAGGVDYLTKPINIDELRARIDGIGPVHHERRLRRHDRRAGRGDRHGDHLDELVGAVPEDDARRFGNGERLAQHRLDMRSSAVRIAVDGNVGDRRGELRAHVRRQAIRVLHRIELDQPLGGRHFVRLERANLRAHDGSDDLRGRTHHQSQSLRRR